MAAQVFVHVFGLLLALSVAPYVARYHSAFLTPSIDT